MRNRTVTPALGLTVVVAVLAGIKSSNLAEVLENPTLSANGLHPLLLLRSAGLLRTLTASMSYTTTLSTLDVSLTSSTSTGALDWSCLDDALINEFSNILFLNCTRHLVDVVRMNPNTVNTNIAAFTLRKDTCSHAALVSNLHQRSPLFSIERRLRIRIPNSSALSWIALRFRLPTPRPIRIA